MNELIENFQSKILERLDNLNDHKKSNQIEEQIHLIFKQLRDNDMLSKLEPLLKHTNNTIANYAATYYLVQDEKKAINALESLAKRKDMDSFIINNTIQQWKNGELNFDY